MRIALVGSPNCGKTSLFNLITGSKFETVNYPGATVEFAKADLTLPSGMDCEFYDTPGLPSLQALTGDEKATLRALYQAESRPDLIVAVADATQLARHLYLIRQMQEVGYNLLVALTMNDLLEQQGLSLDVERLEDRLGIPCIPVDPRVQKDRKVLLEMIELRMGDSCNLLVEDPAQHIANHTEEQVAAHFAEIDLIMSEALHHAGEGNWENSHRRSRRLDRVLLHPFWGLLIFLSVMFALYSSIFWLAAPFMDLLDQGFTWLMDTSREILPDHYLTHLLVDGVIGGIAAMAVFLPQIAILFIMMGALEDSGYLARGAALVDKPLSKIGLNGKAFVPLLSGYACAIPALMAARTIPNRFERLLTMGIVPLMTCSARLPVFTLLVAFMTPKDQPWIGGILMTLIYLSGIVIGAIVSTIVSRFAKKKFDGGFILELPAVRMPIPKILFLSAWTRTKSYVSKAGGTIVLISVILWGLTNFSANAFESGQYVQPEIEQTFAADLGHFLEPMTEPMGLDWRGGIALISGFAAREVFVSSLALVYRVDEIEDEDARNAKIQQMMNTQKFDGTDQLIFTLSTCIGLMLFYMIALQCFPTVATAKVETGSWKFALGQLFAMTGFAWVVAVVVVQGLRFLGVA